MMSINEMGSGSGSENGMDQNPGQQPVIRGFRHTPHQTGVMKAFFENCPLPNPEQRMQLAEELGLEERKVKYWFQNQRNQVKARQNQNDNVTLRAENNRLQVENQRLLTIISRVLVPPARTMELAAYLPVVQLSDEAKLMAVQFAVQYMKELRIMCEVNEPLWHRTNDGREFLNVGEYYSRMFPWQNQWNEYLRTEASRASTMALINSKDLIETFCNADKWKEMFPSIVSKAQTLQTVKDSENFNGTLYVMYAELQMLSPVMLPREFQFFRYCQKNDDGSWGIVDFPLETVLNYTDASPSGKCTRKPSGCIIQDWSRCACSRVTWLEHVEVEDVPMHSIVDQFVNSGTAFGADKWLSVLQRQSERLNSLTSWNDSDYGVSLEQKSNLMNVAKRMMRSFCFNLGTLSGQSWMTEPETPEDQSIRIRTRTSANEPGHPSGLILSAAATTTLQYSHVEVFDLLRDIHRAPQIMEICSGGSLIQEVAHIATGSSHPGNCISVFQIYDAMQVPTNFHVLKESYKDKYESAVAYTGLDVSLLTANSGSINVLPVGFVVLPLPPTTAESSQQHSRCLLTIGIQAVASVNPYDTANLLSAVPVQTQVDKIIDLIKMALSGASAPGSDVNMGMIDHQ